MKSIVLSISRKFKALYLNLFRTNFQFDSTTIIDPKTVIDNRGNELNIGKNVYLRSISKGYHAGMPFPTSILMDVKGAVITIGDNTRINGAYIHAKKGISIGSSCVIASGVNIIDSNGHMVKSKDRTGSKDTPKEIIIEDNVWIGLNSIILKGSIIGENSIVAAGSVVQGVFPPNSIIQGNKAKVVDEII